MEEKEYVESCIERLEAPVKQEYCRKATTYKPYVELVGDGKEAHGVVLSRKKAKKERALEKQSTKNICRAVALGKTCDRGDVCKFNHDVEAYMREKKADLPGVCPFVVGREEGCPHGLTCRFASSHGGHTADAVDATASTAPSSDVHTAEGREGEERCADGDATWWWRGDGSVDAGTVVPVVPVDASNNITSCKVHNPINTLSKDVQVSLRKKTYDFSKADGILDILGIKNSMKMREKGGTRDREKLRENHLEMIHPVGSYLGENKEPMFVMRVGGRRKFLMPEGRHSWHR